MNYTIKKGKHHPAWWWIPKPIIAKSYQRTITFTDSCRYSGDEYLNEEVNKLCGFSLFRWNWLSIGAIGLILMCIFGLYFEENELKSDSKEAKHFLFYLFIGGIIFGVISFLIMCCNTHWYSVRIGWRYVEPKLRFKYETEDGIFSHGEVLTTHEISQRLANFHPFTNEISLAQGLKNDLFHNNKNTTYLLFKDATEIVEGDNIALYLYEYKNGKRLWKITDDPICYADIGEKFEIDFEKSHLCIKKIPPAALCMESLAMLKNKCCIDTQNQFKRIIGFGLNCYFGGTEPAPHDITISIEK